MAEGLGGGHAPLDQGGLDHPDGAGGLQALVAEQQGAVDPQAGQLVGDVLQGAVSGQELCGEFELIVGRHGTIPPNSTAR